MTTSTVNNHTAPRAADAAAANRDGGAEEVVGAALTKSDSQEDTWSSTNFNYVNPFVHSVHIDNRFDMAKIYVLTVLLVPLRVVGCVLSLLTAWVFACIGLYGMTLEDLRAKPISGWRKVFQHLTAGAMRMVYTSGSFHRITFKGKQATPKEAPIVVVAPHSSYVDSIVVVATGPPSIVAKRETSDIPVLGKIINFAQPIYVQREDPHSRQNTIREIVDRATSEDEWPQVVIFAEGTCTNRKALIKFKAGAFYPGVPVQPVIMRYPNRYDTCTWTWDGPGVLSLLWMTMASFYNRCEIEFLPVYVPNEAEKANANLFANNVRAVMAQALGVPTSEYSFEDVILMTRAKDMRIPFPGDIVEIERILNNLGLLESHRDSALATDFLSLSNTERVDLITFGEMLQIDLKNTQFHQLFALLDHHRQGFVSLKSFLLCSFFCKLKNEENIEFLKAIINIYAESSQNISREVFSKLLRHTKIPQDQHNALYFAIDTTNRGFISFDDFVAHTKTHPKYKSLYKKHEQIRRPYQNKNDK